MTAKAKKYVLAVPMFLAATIAPVFGQAPPNYIGRVGGVTKEVCTVPTVTAGAYVAGNVVGGLITLSGAFGMANSGVLQSVRLTSRSTQTAEFDVTLFSAQPSSTFADHAAPSIVAADTLLVQPPVKLTNNSSLLGTATVYGADNIARGIKATGSSLYAIVTTPGTPTFTSTADLQLCVGISQD
jgi:hypothetical protein